MNESKSEREFESDRECESDFEQEIRERTIREWECEIKKEYK